MKLNNDNKERLIRRTLEDVRVYKGSTAARIIISERKPCRRTRGYGKNAEGNKSKLASKTRNLKKRQGSPTRDEANDASTT